MIKSVLPVKNARECFQAQKILKDMGFSLDSYNEYTMQETWIAGDITVIIELQA